MNQIIYYTFSTMAQVLAAAIALIGVYAIFRLQALRGTLSGLAQNFYDEVRFTLKHHSYGKTDGLGEEYALVILKPLKQSMLSKNYEQIKKEQKDFITNYEKILVVRDQLDKHLAQIEIEFDKELFKHGQIKRKTIWTSGYTGVIIIITTMLIWILPDSDICTQKWVIAGMILLYGLSIYFIIALIIKSL